ncbi:mucin-2-like [Penaeus indicus]|uniref:mucin-2-like n=1 Tax=Penaeus indicus TaxID=29960 RepID=UPI00300C67AF
MPPPTSDAASCQPKCVIPNSLVPDPMDCTHYYICVFLRGLTPHPVRARCPSTKPFFHRTKLRCESEARCIEMCSVPSTLPETTAPSTIEDLHDPCLPSCVRPESVVKDPKDCHHYYTCTVNGNTTILTRMACPPSRPVFDARSESCLNSAECLVTCQESETQTGNGTDNSLMLIPEMCRPNCTQHNTILHDPMDCHYYYVCMIVQGQAYTTRIHCPLSRPVFNLESYSCQAESSCITTCQLTNTTYLPTSVVPPSTTEYPYINSSSSIVTLSPTVMPTYSPTPVNLCRPICSSQHTLVHDPLDCNHFYMCNITRLTPYPHYTPIRGKCPLERPVFDLEKHSCAADIPCITTCEGAVATTPTTLATTVKPISEVAPTIFPGDAGPCNIYCEKPNSIVRDPTSCYHYFLCIFFDGTVPRPLRLRCPREKPVFDAESKTCQSHAPCRTLNCQQTESESISMESITPSPAGFTYDTLTTEGTISEKPTPTESVGTRPTPEGAINTSPITGPVINNPDSNEIITTSPPSKGPSTTRPPSKGPSTTSPPSKGPSTTSPPSKGPSTTRPPSKGPSTTSPPSKGPSTTSPPSEEPSTTSPPSKEPSATSPPSKEPSTTSPPSKEPSTTSPPSKGPSITSPPSKEPSTTSPSSKGPSTTSPPSKGPSTTSSPSKGPSTTSPPSKGPSTTSPMPERPIIASLMPGFSSTSSAPEAPITTYPFPEGMVTTSPSKGPSTTVHHQKGLALPVQCQRDLSLLV